MSRARMPSNRYQPTRAGCLLTIAWGLSMVWLFGILLFVFASCVGTRVKPFASYTQAMGGGSIGINETQDRFVNLDAEDSWTGGILIDFPIGPPQPQPFYLDRPLYGWLANQRLELKSKSDDELIGPSSSGSDDKPPELEGTGLSWLQEFIEASKGLSLQSLALLVMLIWVFGPAVRKKLFGNGEQKPEK